MNFNTILSNIGSALLYISTTLGVILIYIGLDSESELGMKIYLIVGPILLIPIVIILAREYIFETKSKSKFEKELKRFKANAEQITVNLVDAKIKSNNWTDTKVIDNSQNSGLNQVFGDGGRNLKEIERNINVVELLIPYKGEKISYEIRSPKDLTTLRMLLEIKKSTILYIDPKDKKKNYLDLDFLD